MKFQNQLTTAAVLAFGLFASGCSQMAAQKSEDTSAEMKSEPVAKKCWHGRNAKGQCNPRPMAKKPAPRRVAPVRRAPARRAVDPNRHTHPAIPSCTNSVNHVHPNGAREHSHRYSCRRPAMRSMVKPKGTYRGAIQIDKGTMSSYQQ